MSDKTHTPGPWQRKNTGTPTGNPGHLIFTNRKRIARLVELDAENYANAKLIASAPDLLAACEVALEALEHSVPRMAQYEEPRLRHSMAMSKLEAAIKAGKE